MKNLPLPSALELAHQEQLLQHLDNICAAQGGSISFAEYMQIALYAPGLGYYSAGMHKFGQAGDFITAPEISPLFSDCLANQCAEILSAFNHDAIILELGAGSGRMAADLLQFLSQQQRLPKEYWICEVSADLKQRQQTYLQAHCPDFFANIRWLETLPSNPFIGIILANEVIDAMPVELFQISKEGEILQAQVRKVMKGWCCEFRKPLTNTLTQAVAHAQKNLSQPLKPGYTSEINLVLKPWLASLSDCLQQGVMLFLDYGFPRHEYYHPSRSMGTLMCHYRHHAHGDPMSYIGLQDITTHVDFTALSEAAVACDLTVAGFTHQAGFLLANDLLTHAENYSSTTDAFALSQQIQQLTHPHEMGELFKAIAFTKDFSGSLCGFESFDHLHRL